MRRQATILLTVTCLMLGIIPTFRSHAGEVSAAALKSVTLSALPAGTELVLRVDGIYAYKTTQASSDTILIDLTGTEAEGVASSHVWSNSVVAGYKLLRYKDASGQPVVRLQVDTRGAEPFVAQKDASHLRLIFGAHAPTQATAPAPVTLPVPVSAPPVAAAAAPGPVLVSTVAMDQQASGETYVDVATSRSASYRVSTLPNPARLVVDIDDARSTATQKTYVAESAVLKDVRVAQFHASVVRVVADLNGDPAFDVRNTPTGLRLELHPRGMAKSALVATPPPAPAVKPVESKVAVVAAPRVPVKPVESKSQRWLLPPPNPGRPRPSRRR